MKIHGHDTNIDSLKGVFSESRVSGSKITLLAQRILDASERPEKVANITASLEKKGYSEFTVRFDLEGKTITIGEAADLPVFANSATFAGATAQRQHRAKGRGEAEERAPPDHGSAFRFACGLMRHLSL